MSGRLAAYRAGQPPRTANRAAMPDSVSPGCTTYLAAGPAAMPGAAAALSVLARVTWVVLLAMRMFAWTGRAGPVMPAATTMMIVRMLQASPTHADFVHACTVESLSFRGDQRRALAGPDAERHEPVGKESDLSGRHLWEVGAPDGLGGGTTRQPQQDQNEKHDHSSTGGTLHTAVPASGTARATTRAATAVCAAT